MTAEEERADANPMTMIEKVARAIAQEFYGTDGNWVECYPEALAAIQAMMEPTPEMVEAAKAAVINGSDIYTAMLTKALEEE